MTRSANAERALGQLRSLKNLRSAWKLNWAELEATKVLENRSIRPVGERWLIGDADSSSTTEIRIRTRWFVAPPKAIDDRWTSWVDYGVPQGGAYWENGSEWNGSLSDFRDFWNSLSKQLDIVFIQSVSETALMWANRAEFEIPVYPPLAFRLEKVRAADKFADNLFEGFVANLTTPGADFVDWIKSEPTLASVAKDTHLKRFVLLGRRDVTEFRFILIPIKTQTIRFHGQQAFQAAHGTKFPYGKFEDAFPDLNKITKNFQDLPFNRLMAILEDASQTSDRVEMFGAKIPADAVAVWGSPITILLQFYLLLHLSAFRLWLPNWPAVTNVAWIGLYPSWSARFATIFSVALIPTGVIGFLLVKQVSRSAHWWELPLITVAVLASLSIGVASGICLVRIWRIRDCNLTAA